MNISKRAWSSIFSTLFFGLAASQSAETQQRVLGIDVSAWQGNISAANWATLKRATNQQVSGIFGDGREFVVIRSSRGGTTGEDHRQGGYPSGNNTFYTNSQRYDDPYYVQNITRATAAGLLCGTYHFSRPDVIATTLNSDGVTPAGVANSGTDEADHMLQMAKPWMRPGYLPPVLDLEAGDGIRTDNQMAQFCHDFSDRIYSVIGVRPAIYVNGNYAANILQTASSPSPGQTVAAFPFLWSARWPNQTNVPAIDVQNAHPKDSYTPIYGPWDDVPNPTHPWKFWQYASTGRVNAIGGGGSNCDMDVAQGGIEFLKDCLIPALWVINTDGAWTTLANWNSGETPTTPVPGPGQLTPIGSHPLPTARLPGANDTVILDRPSTVTVTLSSGSQTIRRLYMRETLNITGGSLNINYTPSWDSTNIAAQFSGPVTVSSGATLSAHTLLVDATRTFTLNGGTFGCSTLILMPGGSPAKLAIGGDVTFTAVGGTTATITNGPGAGTPGLVDLTGGTRGFNIGSGVELALAVAASNGGIAKSGLGTLRFNSNNTYNGATTISAGTLLLGASGSLPNSPSIAVSNAATFNVSAKAAGFVLGAAQTLSGNGVVNGRVTALGTVSPGASVGTLTFSTNLTLAGTTIMEVSHNGAVLSSDTIACNGTLTYGGTLTILNAGPALVGGEIFTNFVANTYAGAFTATNLPALASGLNWYLGNLNSNGRIKVNCSPVAAEVVVTNGPSGVLQIPLASLTTNATDPDGDSLALAGITLTTTNGVSLTTNASFVTYSNAPNVSDQFSYSLSDAQGGAVTGVVTIVTPPAQFIASPTVDGNSVTVHFSGGPGLTYYVERSVGLPEWTTISTNIMPWSGVLDFTDDFHDLAEPPASALYRLRW